MKKKVWLSMPLVLMLLAFQRDAFAQGQVHGVEKASASRLIDAAKSYDGHEVEITGELIGDVMARGDHAWISILDEGTVLSAWIDSSLLPPGANIGRYSRSGDRVRLSGTFHRACPDHGGDLDIHAKTLELVSKGAPVDHPVDASAIAVGLTLVAIGIMLVVSWRRRERNER